MEDISEIADLLRDPTNLMGSSPESLGKKISFIGIKDLLSWSNVCLMFLPYELRLLV